MAVTQTRELWPTNRVIIGNRCGNIISHPIPTARSPTGITSSHAQSRSRGFRPRQMQADRDG